MDECAALAAIGRRTVRNGRTEGRVWCGKVGETGALRCELIAPYSVRVAWRGHRMPDWKDYQEETASLFRELGCTADTDAEISGARGKHLIEVDPGNRTKR